MLYSPLGEGLSSEREELVTDLAADRRIHPSAEALIDATDQLLGEVGYAGLSSRKITERAGLAHGSIRYHFGSLQALLVAALGRHNEELFQRQAKLYASGMSPRELWRVATREYLEADLASGWGQRLVEALLIGIRDREAGQALAAVLEPWRGLMEEGTRRAIKEYGLDLPDHIIDGIAALVDTSQLGMMVHRLAGNDRHHEEALDAVDALLAWLEQQKADAEQG